ncbi:MAG TPA: IS110 family transposase [Caulobacteraceae bacterium]|jgi:transposase
MSQHRNGAPVGAQYGTILLVFELSKAKWKIGVLPPGSEKLSRYTVDGGDTAAVAALLAKARSQAGGSARIVSAYEAGYDGFWLHRWLSDQGVENRVLDSASIQVNRRARRAKTDKLDLGQLMRVLAALERGEPKVCSLARAPSPDQEDARRLTRERQRLVCERGGHTNRIKGLLHAQGVRGLEPREKGFAKALTRARTGDGRPLGPQLLAEIGRELQRLALASAQIGELEAQARAVLAESRAGETRTDEAGAANAAKVAQLAWLRGIGETSAWPLVNEVFWRRFDNRRQVGGYFGLDGTPYDSGASRKEQGISKAGNRRARTLAIELAWLWLRHQPDSDLSRWFFARVGQTKGRIRKIALVALARKLMVALWRYLETGVVPNGAVVSPARG